MGKIKFRKNNEIFLKKLNDIKGQALHAQTLGFTHQKIATIKFQVICRKI